MYTKQPTALKVAARAQSVVGKRGFSPASSSDNAQSSVADYVMSKICGGAAARLSSHRILGS